MSIWLFTVFSESGHSNMCTIKYVEVSVHGILQKSIKTKNKIVNIQKIDQKLSN